MPLLRHKLTKNSLDFLFVLQCVATCCCLDGLVHWLLGFHHWFNGLAHWFDGFCQWLVGFCHWLLGFHHWVHGLCQWLPCVATFGWLKPKKQVIKAKGLTKQNQSQKTPLKEGKNKPITQTTETKETTVPNHP